MKHLLIVAILLNSLSIWSLSNQNQELDIILNELKVELAQPRTVLTNGFEFGSSISLTRTRYSPSFLAI